MLSTIKMRGDTARVTYWPLASSRSATWAKQKRGFSPHRTRRVTVGATWHSVLFEGDARILRIL